MPPCDQCRRPSVVAIPGYARCHDHRLRHERAPRRERSSTDRNGMRRVVGRLAVTCWCEAAIRYVPRALILRGETVSCGAPGCQPEAA